MNHFIKTIPVLLLCFISLTVQAAESVPMDVLGIRVPLRAAANLNTPRMLPKNQIVAFPLKNIMPGSYHLAVEVRSADVTGEDGKNLLGGYNYLLPELLYQFAVNGKDVPMQISCRSPIHVEDDKRTKTPVYVGWLLSSEALDLKPTDRPTIRCNKGGGFIRRIMLLDEKAWEAEKMRASDLPQARTDLGWGALFNRTSIQRWYQLKTLDDVVKALEYFSAGFAKPYLQGNPYEDLIAEGKALHEKIQSYRDADGADAAAIRQGAELAKEWKKYFAKMDQALCRTISPAIAKLRAAVDFQAKGIALNKSCSAGREAIFARDVALQYAAGAEAELKKLGDPADLNKLRILYALTYADNAAEFTKTAEEFVAKPQTTVEFPDYFVAAPESKNQLSVPATKFPRGEICLNGEWEFSINNGPDSPPKPGQWPRKQRVPHGEWGFAINKGNIPDEQWLKQARGYWDWWETNVWYHTEFDVPFDWTGRRFVIAFEEVEGCAEVFVNGRYCDSHYTGLIPFEIDVTKHLVPGARNNILVYVTSPLKTTRPGLNYRYVTKPNLYATRCLEAYFGGITGDVYLRSTPKTRIVETYVRTWADKRIRVETTVKNGTDQPVDQPVAGVIRKDGKDVFTLPAQKVHLEPGEEKTVVTEAVWPDAQLWGIGGEYGSPKNRYFLVSNLGEIDTAFTEFGFREMTIQGPNFYLNGKRILLQGDNFSAAGRNHPLRSRWYINQFFRVSREANITFTRAHQHSMCPDHAEIADRIGILLEPEACWWTLHPPCDIVSQRTDPELLKNGWPYGNRAVEDPVWRKNCREYYQSLVKRYRNNPSVTIFSTENESLDGVTADTILQFNQWIKEVAPHLITDCQSNGSVWDDRFEIANFHDYDLYVPRMEEWAAASGPNHKPIIIGEFWNPSMAEVVFHAPRPQAKAAEWAMVKWIERRFGEYIEKLNASPMFFTFDYGSGALWSNGDAQTNGPWADLIEAGTFNSIINIDWPSLSGRGWLKAERFLAAPNTGAVNFCDPARVATVTTKVFDAFRKVYKDTPGWSNERQPELIVTVLQGGKSVPGVNVFLAPKANQAAEPIGVKADADGKAWFIVKEPGTYAVQISCNGKIADNEVTLAATEIENRGGFEYIPRATVDLDQPDKMTVALPEKTPLIRPKSTKAEANLPPLPDLEQGTASVSQEGFIRDWLVCGPFMGGGRDTEDQNVGWDVDYLTPTGGELETTPKPDTIYHAEFKETKYAYWQAATFDVSWRRYVSPEDYVDLGKTFVRNDVKGLDFAPAQFVVGYAACTIDSPTEQDVVFTIGSDDGYKLYLNHKLLAANRVYRGATKDEDKVPVHLRKGKNLLMLKIEQDVGGYGFFLRILDKNSKPLNLPVVNSTPLIAIQKDGWIRNWLIVGPFANPGRGLNETTWATDYLAPNGGEAKIKPAAGMKYVAEFAEDSSVSWTPGKAAVAWRPVEAQKDGFVNLSKEFVTDQIKGLDFPPVEYVLGYAAVYVYCDAPTKTRLEIDTINGVKVWFNHQLVFDKHIHRYNTDPASPNKTIFEEGNYFQNVELKKGANILLLKLDVANGPFQFKCRFIDEKAQPIPNLRVGMNAPSASSGK